MDMLIDGGWTQARTAPPTPCSTRPTKAEIDTVPRATAADVDRAVAAAQAGQRADGGAAGARALRDSPSGRRSHRAQPGGAEPAALPRERQDASARRRARSGVGDPHLPRLCRGGEAHLRPRRCRSTAMPGRETSLAITMRKPRGVIAAIVPFNYPAELWTHKAAGALAAGNAVITKPPEECPLTVIEISRISWRRPACRAARIRCVTGRARLSARRWSRADGVQMIAMTGSTAGRPRAS